MNSAFKKKKKTALSDCNSHIMQLTHLKCTYSSVASPVAQAVRNLPAMQETQEMWVQSMGQEESLKKEMATHSSVLAWKILQTEKPGKLQSIE